MFEVSVYQPSQAAEWDAFVHTAKNGLFLFLRPYMDYHKQRFTDHSLMVYRRNQLYAVLPGHAVGRTFYSHQGLTFGGLLLQPSATCAPVVDVFTQILAHLKACGFQKMVYKPAPWPFHSLPTEEDLYAIFRTAHPQLVAREASTVINLQQPLAWRKDRRTGVRKATAEGIIVEESHRWEDFWLLLTENLQQRHHTLPTHTIEEMRLLHARFPQNIQLFIARQTATLLAGAVVYDYGATVHTQYLATSKLGRQQHALDALLHKLITERYANRDYFDFGKSTEHEGRYLNTNLIYQKEGFGGRTICCDTYEWTL